MAPMKNKLILGLITSLLLVVFIWVITAPKNCSSYDEYLYINSHGEVTDAIVRLLGFTGIRIEGDILAPENDWPKARLTISSRKLNNVVQAVQGKDNPSITWLGDLTKERWELDSTKPVLSLLQAQYIIAICEKALSQGPASFPQEEPKAILFLGSTLLSVRQRLAFLNSLYESKKIPNNIPVYILTGERKLNESIGETQTSLFDSDNGIVAFRSDWQKLGELIVDEGMMIELVFAQSRHKTLDEKNIKLVYSLKDQGRRATTESTIIQWLKDTKPEKGLYLAISNQPYNFYQESVFRRVLLKAGNPDICVNVVGPAIKITAQSEYAIINQAQNLLNNLSRILYELRLIRSSDLRNKK